MRKVTRSTLSAAVATAALVLTAGVANAQQESQPKPQSQQECTATLEQSTVPAGQKAVALNAAFSKDIGEVKDISAPEGSGIAKATPSKEQTKMAMEKQKADEGQQKMADEAATHTLWLSTESAKPGTYALTVKGEKGLCTAQVTVGGEQKPSEDTGDSDDSGR